MAQTSVGEECVICFVPMVETEYIKLPNCSHQLFHQACLAKCTKQECPLCRASHDIELIKRQPAGEDFSWYDFFTEEQRNRLDFNVVFAPLAQRRMESHVLRDLARHGIPIEHVPIEHVSSRDTYSEMCRRLSRFALSLFPDAPGH